MARTAYLSGDWVKAGIALKRLSTAITPNAEAQLIKDGEEILQKMVGHIDSQDLGWSPVSEDTVRQKGHSSNYIETGWLRDNLDIRRVKGNTIFIGASPWKTHSPSGEKFSTLMMYQEYGTSTQPARPLIRPTWDEVRPSIEKNWEDLIRKLVSK